MIASLSLHAARKAHRLAAGGALAAALTIAALGTGAFAHDTASPAKVEAALAKGNVEEAVRIGEEQVRLSPREASLRAALGHAYMRDGRFASAAVAFTDAQALGDRGGRSALGLALAQIASGHGQAAMTTLAAGREMIPVGDYGLALALAGDTARGVSVLSDAVRAGQGDPQLRQNLAYAFALDGRWADAKITASIDVPADKLDAQIGEWSRMMKPGDEQARVAALLGVQPRADQGMPQELALAAPAAVPASGPASGPAAAAPTELAAADAPAPAPAAASTSELPAAAPADVAAMPVPVAPPVLAATPAPAPMPAAFVEARPATLPQPAGHHFARIALSAPAGHGNRVVQLGAFLSKTNAENSKAIFARRHPELAGHSFAINQAVVHGQTFYRVTATGFDLASAADACSLVRRGGGGCFAYARGAAFGGEALAFAGPVRRR
jgi:Flp pilus assembly protein TadD